MKTEKENREIRLKEFESDRKTLQEVTKKLRTELYATSPNPIIEVINEMMEFNQIRIEEEKESIKSLSVS